MGGIEILIICCILLCIFIPVGLKLYKKYKDKELEKNFIKGFTQTYKKPNPVDPAPAKSSASAEPAKNIAEKAVVNNKNQPCSEYIDSSTNLSISCLQQIWKDAGCTTTDRIFTTDFYKENTMSAIKEDSKQWATLKDDTHRIGCYGATNSDKFKEVVSSDSLKHAAIGAAIQIAMSKLSVKVLAKIAFKLEQKGLMLTARVLGRIGTKFGIKALQRLGIRAGEKAAGKLAATVGVKVGTKVATKIGASAATAATVSAPTGGLAYPFVMAGLLAFDVLSLGLDLGDAGGYEKMATKQIYIEMKKKIDQEMQKEFQDAGGVWPSVIGPLDSISADELNAAIAEQSNIIMDSNNKDPLVKPMLDKLTEDLEKEILKVEDLDNDDKMKKYTDLLDMDAIYNKAFSVVCINKKGKVVGPTQCSYQDKASCESSYSWPPKEDETYAEFKPNILGGACIASSYGIRSMCDDNGIPYNSETGICKIDETYCKMKGADWKYNDSIKENDCIIPSGQDVMENILGTTITRGLKQIFDPAQYETCKDNETDDGYFCRSRGCGEDEEPDIAGGVCHAKCKPNYGSNGITMCLEDCPRYGEIKVKNKCVNLPNGDTSNGIKPTLWDCNGTTSQQFYFNGDEGTIKSLKDTNKCLDIPGGNAKSKQSLQLWQCNGTKPQKFTYNDSNGTFSSQSNPKLCLDFSGGEIKNNSIIELNECNGSDSQSFNMEQSYGLRSDLTCTKRTPSRVADCPPGYTNNGATCGRGADTINIGAGRVADCPPGYTNQGTWCQMSAPGGIGRVADCPRNYTNMGATCTNWSIFSLDTKGMDEMTCNADEFKSGARCYKNCPYGGTNTGLGTCTTGMGDMVCNADEFKSGARCYKYCPEGYTNTGVSCYKPPSTLGMGSMVCRPDEEKIGARCYPKTFPGFQNYLEFASYNKSIYDRGVGSPSVKIRPKKRVVPFSTKDN